MTQLSLIRTVSFALTALIGLWFCFAFIQQTVLQLGTEPKELPTIDTALTKITWTSIVQGHYSYFESKYPYSNSSDTSKDISINTREVTHAMTTTVSGGNPIVKKFYKSLSAQTALYNWVKPHYIDGFKKLPNWKKNIFRRMLIHAKKYITEFNYNAELQVYKTNPNLFVFNGTKGKRGDFRRLEAFIFRRVHKGDLTLQQMLKWVNILQKDIDSIK